MTPAPASHLRNLVRSWLPRVVLACLLLFPLPAFGAEVVKIGVMAFRPKPQTLAQWQPLAIALKQALPGHDFVVEAYTYPELNEAVAQHKVDFVLTNPGHYVMLAQSGCVSAPLATLAIKEAGQRASFFGGVIFTRVGQTAIATLEDLRGKAIASPSTESLGGYQAQAFELSQIGVHLPQDCKLITTGMPHDTVVEAVLSGRAEVGFVRSGLLEGMARNGKLDLQQINIINRQNPANFPVQVSTRLYPEWAFSALPQVDENLARHVAATLFLLEENPAATTAMGIHGFSIPANYGSVEALLRELRLPPFEAAPVFSPKDIWNLYRWQIYGALLVAGLIVWLLVRLQLANRRLGSEQRLVLLRQQQLQESEESYRRQFTDNTAIMLMIDPGDGRILEANAAAVSYYGYSREQLLALRIADINTLPPGRVQAALDSLGVTQSERFVFQHRLADGSLRDVEVSVSRIQMGNHQVLHSIIHDITERKLAEATLRASEERNRAITESAHDAIVTSGQAGKIIGWNHGAETLFGYSEAEAMGQPLAILIPERYREGHLAGMHRMGTGGPQHIIGKTVELSGLRKDQSEFLLELSLARWETGTDWYVTAIIRDITERRQADESLRVSEQQLLMAQQIGHAGSWVHSIGTETIWGSAEGFRIFGFPPVAGEIPIAAIEACIQERERVHQALVDLIGIGREYNLEYAIKPADGSLPKTVLSVANLERDAHGKPIRVMGFVQDITARKQAEVALRESEQNFRGMFENSADGILLVSLDGHVRDANPKACVMNGYTHHEFIGMHGSEFVHPEHVWQFRDSIAATQAGETYTAESINLRKDGTPLPIEVHITPFTHHGESVLLCNIHDITERKQAEEKLSNNERRLKSIFTAMTEGFSIQEVVCDETGRPCDLRFIEANPAFELQTGLKNADALGHTLLELFPQAEPYWIERYGKVGLTGEPTHFEANFGPLGKCYQVSAFQTEPGRFGTLFTDINERKQAEEEKAKLQAQLQQSQKMESLGTLAGGVAHDMNNVLGAILGLASAHIGSQPYGSPLHQALDTICKATERGGKMVKSLLSFARQSPSENNKLDLNAILREQVALLERTTLAKVRLVIDLEADLRPILGDASALTHAFMNLCVNAVDAMPENGTLTLHSRNIDNDWIEVVVEDNGMGMPKEVLEKAMDPFYTTKGVGKGTGLGLSMVFSTVKAHRGQMSIESEQGKGTRVMLRFPACVQETPVQAAAPVVVEATQAPQKTMKVLLVDDDDLIQSSIQAILEVLGHTAVTTAQSGEEALAMLEAALEVDLVILDMNMPGLGGIGTLPRLRALRPEVPVLLATGRVDQTALTLASAHPGVTLLSKPFGLRELQKQIESLGLG